MNFSVRSFTEKDLPRIIAITNNAYLGTHEFTPYTAETIQEWVGQGNFKVLVAEEAGEVLGSVSYRNGHWGENIEWLAVTERTDKKAIEKELVQEIEKQVQGETVFTAVEENSPKINEWAERGYTPQGGLYHMITELTAPKQLPEVPEGIVLRSLGPEEEKEFVDAVNAGFGWERLETGIIKRWKDDCPPFDEEWVHVAEAEDKIVSAVASRPDAEYNEFFHGNRGYLGPAATLPDFRGKHLASALTVRAMNHLLGKGMTSASLYTSEQNATSISLLLNLSFRKAHLWKFMRKNLKKT